MTEQMVADYQTGNYSIAMIGKKYGISTGKTYYVLRDAGCAFSRKRRKPVTDEERARRSAAMKGREISEAQKIAISIRNSCNYNGMNGYGHTKKIGNGYIEVYAPLHPHARVDGYVMLHTLIMERYIGRYLKDDEVVHHVNHCRDDNRIENLILMNKHEHMSMHMKERHAKKEE